MSVLRRIPASLLFLALTALPGLAREVVVTLDPAKSTVQFTLGDVLHTVHGTFKIKSGEVRYDPATGKAAGQIVIDVKSGDTGSAARDRRMHKDILESDKYPEAVFVPDKIAPDSVHGTLRIHGADHDVTFATKVQMQGGDVTASSSFTLPYVQWGMKNPSNFILRVNPTVDLQMNVTGRNR